MLREQARCMKVTKEGDMVAKKSVMVFRRKKYKARTLSLGQEGRCMKVSQEAVEMAMRWVKRFLGMEWVAQVNSQTVVVVEQIYVMEYRRKEGVNIYGLDKQ